MIGIQGGEGRIEMRQQRCLLVAASPPRPTIDKPLLSDARALAAAAWQENSSLEVGGTSAAAVVLSSFHPASFVCLLSPIFVCQQRFAIIVTRPHLLTSK